VLAGQRLCFAKNIVVDALCEKHRLRPPALRVVTDGLGQRGQSRHALQLKMIQLGGAGKQVHVIFREARQYRLLVRVDHPRCGTVESLDLLLRTDGDDPPVAKRHRLGIRVIGIESEDTRVDYDDVGRRCHGMLAAEGL